jgi:chromosome segregation ATPase
VAALREERGKNAELLSRGEATEARALAAEGSRDEWAQTAAALRTRAEEQEAEMQSLRRAMAGARETAVSAAELAETGHARIREVQEQLGERDGRIRALEAELQGREDEARRLEEAMGRIAWLEQELRRGGESKEALEAERADLAARLEEAASTVRALEGERRTLAKAREESDAERARLALETARLEAERDRLQSERDRLQSEGNQARKDLEVALDRITALSVAPSPVTSDSGPVLDGPSPPKSRRGSRKARG